MWSYNHWGVIKEKFEEIANGNLQDVSLYPKSFISEFTILEIKAGQHDRIEIREDAEQVPW